MHSYLLALILGIVEGLTEFLPVSSTAHLRICQSLFGIALDDGYWKMFAIVIQLGAILTLPIYFRERIAKFLTNFPQGERGERTALTHPLTLTIIAFACTAAPSFLLTKLIGKNLESLLIMGLSLVIGGIVMWAVDVLYVRGLLAHSTEHVEEMSLGQAAWIGLCQTLSAVFPGISRSMSTIAAGQLVGMSRPSALEFSFFLSIPTMVAATLYDLIKSLRPHDGEPSVIGQLTMNPPDWITLVIGFVVSFVVAYGVVAWFMHWVRTHGFAIFAAYRIVAGVAVLWWAFR
jgi:undecaprenyl-diphosphatase